MAPSRRVDVAHNQHEEGHLSFIDEIRAEASIPFQEVEYWVWEQTVQCFRTPMIDKLSACDDALHAGRAPAGQGGAHGACCRRDAPR